MHRMSYWTERFLTTMESILSNVVGMVKIKRTYRGVVVNPHFMVKKKHGLPDTLIIPVGQFAGTTSRLDEVILGAQ